MTINRVKKKKRKCETSGIVLHLRFLHYLESVLVFLPQLMALEGQALTHLPQAADLLHFSEPALILLLDAAADGFCGTGARASAAG